MISIAGEKYSYLSRARVERLERRYIQEILLCQNELYVCFSDVKRNLEAVMKRIDIYATINI